jgi:Tfp pilus assembly protein PilX
MKTQRHHNESGIALILTLTILAVVLILLMAFITSMRTERISAKAFSDLSKTKALAEGAVDEAVAILQGSMTNITPTTSYITAPGVVYTWSAGAWNAATLSISGVQQDLNTSNAITGAGGVPLQVGWQKVFTTDANPQIIGRFTYWIDDESTKVNVNTAQLRANDPLGYTPAAVDLSQLFSPAEAGNISTYVANTRPLDSIESIKLSNTVVVGAPSISPNSFSNNEFFITANATSPDVTPWGTKRTNFVAVATNTTLTTIQKVQIISNALDNANLLAWYGKTFTTKYPNLGQIAANIIDYIDTDTNCTDSGTGPLDLNPPAFLGLEQTPYLNEISIQNTVVGSPGAGTDFNVNFSTSDRAELWYMYTNADWALPAGTTEIVFLNRPTITVTPAPPGTVNGAASVTLTLPLNATIPVNGGILLTSPYRPFTRPGSEVLTPSTGSMPLDMTTNIATIVLNSGTLTAIFRNQTSGRIDYAVIPLTNYTVNFDASLLTPTNVTWASACNDPRVKPVSNNWVPVGAGMANSSTIFAPDIPGVNTGVINQNVVTPPGIAADGDASCHIVSGSRDRGTMYPSELAYIHTGLPWRTFWLEPQPAAESGSVPDWLAVDLFSTTDLTNVAGRINVNAQDFNTASPPRVLPLKALLGSSNPTVPNNILNYAVHTTPTAVSFVPAADKYFTTAGQICEVTGLADGGGLKSVREAPAMGIVNLVTPRSDTFTIWAMAQGIKKVPLAGSTVITQPKNYVPPPSGTDLITGEVKIQAVVQRYEDTSTTPATVRFRTLYYRYIYQ